MATVISVASGKGGVGKSVVVTNLGLLLSSVDTLGGDSTPPTPEELADQLPE